MNKIWNGPAAVILTVLAAAGISAIAYGIYRFWVTKTGNRRQIEEGEAITFIAVSFFAGLVIAAMPLMNQVATDAIRAHESDQSFNCRNSLTKDGKEITEEQCQYFENVLNGKYVDEDSLQDIEDSKRVGY